MSYPDLLFIEYKEHSAVNWNIIQVLTGVAGWNNAEFDISADDTLIDFRIRLVGGTIGNFILFDNLEIDGDPTIYCGNDVIDSGESCDGINMNGETCQTQGYDYGTIECDGNCNFDLTGCRMFGQCGNSFVDPNEDCDDGNFNNHDDCPNTCLDPVCGDGYLWEGHEACDDGNLINGDGCSSVCEFEPTQICEYPLDVMMVIDRSGSMDQLENGHTRLENAKSAAQFFIGLMDTDDQLGIVSFASEATLDQEMTFDHGAVLTAVNNIQIHTPPPQRTNIGEGIKKAQDEIELKARNRSFIILLSDGAPNEWNEPSMSCWPYRGTQTECTLYALNQSERAKNSGVEMFVIGLGVNNLTEDLLRQMATDDNHYFSAADSSTLQQIYEEIVDDLCPCNGFDCTLNDDECNYGYCDEQANQCRFEPLPLSTFCETDNDLCTEQHCDGNGACSVLSEVDCGLPGLCEKDRECNPLTGICEPIYDNPGTICENDNNLCTNEECDVNGNCVVVSEVDCSYLDDICSYGSCDAGTGNCYLDYLPFSTVCETDANICTVQHCDGNGQCVSNPLGVLPSECYATVIKDSKVAQALPMTNFGHSRYMIVNPKVSGKDRNYIRINASKLVGQVLNRAELKIAVYYTGNNAVGSTLIAYYCPDHDFDEFGINWNNQPLDEQCEIADSIIVNNSVIAGTPVEWHSFDLLTQTNLELTTGDGLFTVVLVSSNENNNIQDNSYYVQYLTNDYSEQVYRPKFEIN